jgi:hypothetical protein
MQPKAYHKHIHIVISFFRIYKRQPPSCKYWNLDELIERGDREYAILDRKMPFANGLCVLYFDRVFCSERSSL